MKSKFEKWCNNLSSDEIDLVDKLCNMYESEISEELIELINDNKEKYYPRIEQFIRENIKDYADFIKSETTKLWEEKLINDKFDYSSGLYNCDEIYVRAIIYALGILWMPN